jgi:hypothetical protein
LYRILLRRRERNDILVDTDGMCGAVPGPVEKILVLGLYSWLCGRVHCFVHHDLEYIHILGTGRQIMPAKQKSKGKQKKYGPKMADPRFGRSKEKRNCGPLGRYVRYKLWLADPDKHKKPTVVPKPQW